VEVGEVEVGEVEVGEVEVGEVEVGEVGRRGEVKGQGQENIGEIIGKE